MKKLGLLLAGLTVAGIALAQQVYPTLTVLPSTTLIEVLGTGPGTGTSTNTYASIGTLTKYTNSSAFGTAPVLSACGGGTPAVVGNDLTGTITMGTSATGCVVTFAIARNAAPNCMVTWLATPLASQSFSTTTTALTLVQTSTSSNKASYYCPLAPTL